MLSNSNTNLSASCSRQDRPSLELKRSDFFDYRTSLHVCTSFSYSFSDEFFAKMLSSTFKNKKITCISLCDSRHVYTFGAESQKVFKEWAKSRDQNASLSIEIGIKLN